jgi:rhodanese-related sulfurtransferase
MKTFLSFLCALALSPLVAFAADQFPSISQDQLKQAMAEKKVCLIDVNGSESFKAGHIPGAIDFEVAQAKFASELPKNKSALVVAYCGNEECPLYKAAARKAEQLGYTNVKHFAPGIQGWVKSGAPVQKGS